MIKKVLFSIILLVGLCNAQQYMHFQFDDAELGMDRNQFLKNHKTVDIPNDGSEGIVGIKKYGAEFGTSAAIVWFLDNKLYLVMVIYKTGDMCGDGGFGSLYGMLTSKIGRESQYISDDKSNPNKTVAWFYPKRRYELTQYRKPKMVILMIRDEYYNNIVRQREAKFKKDGN